MIRQFKYSRVSEADIGNPTSAKSGGDANGWNLRTPGCSANNLNQYTAITTPGYEDIIGVTWATNAVTINGGLADRKGEYFHREVSIANGSGPVWQSITVSSGGSNVTGYLLFPPYNQSPTYDADGNLTADGLWTYAWDAENRLVSVTSQSTVTSSARRKVEFAYDHQGRRIQKIVSTNNRSTWYPAFNNRFVWDGQVLLAILDHTNGLMMSFMRGVDLSGSQQGAGGVGGLLFIGHFTSAIGHHAVAYDGNGNVTALVDAASGEETARYEYGPFGEAIRMTGPMATLNPVRFSTQYADDVTGDVKYLFRDYGASEGRWSSRDPIGDIAFVVNNRIGSDSQRQNLQQQALLPPYLFVRNNPITRFDVFGLYENCCCDGSMIDRTRRILIGRYAAAESYLDPHRPLVMPEEGSWSCLNVARNVGNFMKPIPPCWTCYVENRRAPTVFVPFEGYVSHDLNVVVCASHPKSGKPQKIAFDYWHHAPAGEDYSAVAGSYPYFQSVDPNFTEGDCSKPIPHGSPNYGYLDLITDRPPPTNAPEWPPL